MDKNSQLISQLLKTTIRKRRAYFKYRQVFSTWLQRISIVLKNLKSDESASIFFLTWSGSVVFTYIGQQIYNIIETNQLIEVKSA